MTHYYVRGKHYVEAFGHGKTPAKGFKKAVSNSRKEHGRGNDAGTIAEKPGFVVIELDPRVYPYRVIAAVYDIFDGTEALSDMAWDKEDRRRAERSRVWLEQNVPDDYLKIPLIVDNESGPAVCFLVTGKVRNAYLNRNLVPRGEKVYMFAGRCTGTEPANN
jgi:hypothetical protein